MDTRYREETNYHNQQDQPQLKRVSIEPEEEMAKLDRNEIGIKSNLKGSEIKEYIDRVIYKLVYNGVPKVTLKAIGKLQ
jgi:23S rRNA maturation-related 3'-5' exoribonuclease YhaM